MRISTANPQVYFWLCVNLAEYTNTSDIKTWSFLT